MAPQASSFPLRHLTVALACAGLALVLAGCASAPPQASAAHAQAPAAPAMPEYSLLLPAHLPHLMPFVAKLDASPEHQQALSRYADEQVRPALRPRLQQAQQLEQEIARAALDGRSAQDLAPQLDRLAQVRREAAEIHLRCIAQVRQTLPPEQYARLLALAQPAAR